MPRRIITIHSVSIFFLCGIFSQAQGIITTIAGGGQFQFTGAGSAAVNVPLGVIQGVATDQQGNVYASDATNFLIVKIAPSGVLTIVAGNGSAGTSGDGGPATSASLQTPAALAVDSAGDVFFVDGNRVRKVTPQGVISTFAGSLSPGDSGDGGPATQALLSPHGLAVDPGGNLDIVSGCRVRKVTPQGIISGIAGNSNLPCFAIVDGVPALDSPLNFPSGIAVAQNGVMYIAQSQDGRIRRVGTDGIITTIAGANGRGFSGDGGPATAAMLNSPNALALDNAGDLYISDSDRIREITTDGIIHTITGTGTPNFTGDHGLASLATISPPMGVATDVPGSVFIADSANFRIRKIDLSGIITTYAGSGNLGFAGDGGEARDAVLNSPRGIVVDSAGNVLFSDQGNNRIRKIAPNGVITTIAGGNAPGFAGDGGPATQALLNFPLGLALDHAGNLYIDDAQNYRVRKIDTNGVITTVAGNGPPLNPTGFDTGDGGRAVDATLSSVTDIALDAQGNLYIVEDQILTQSAIRRVSPDGTISTFALGPGENLASITVDTAGNVYASATPPPSFNGIPTFGSAFGYTPDGKLSIALPASTCGAPMKGMVDVLGNLYLPEAGLPGNLTEAGDCTFNAVLRISPTGVLTTVAGISPQAGFTGDGGPSPFALLNAPNAVALDAAGNLYIADTGNNRIREVLANPPLEPLPSALSLTSDGTQNQFNFLFPENFTWTASSNADWITLFQPSSGTGSGRISFSIAPNAGADRSGTITVGNLTFTVQQEGASIRGLSLIGSMPHFAAYENWTTTFTLVNKSAQSAVGRLSFFGDTSQRFFLIPGPTFLDLTFPQEPSASGSTLTESLDQTISPNASFIASTATGFQNNPVEIGSTQVAATGAVDGFAIFHLIPGAQEAVVPLETRNASSYVLAFDNTNGVVLGVAVANVVWPAPAFDLNEVSIGVVIRDEGGAVIGTDTLAIDAGDHRSFVLSAKYPITANIRGTVEFDTPPGGQISVLGIRTTPLGTTNTLTTVPPLANVGTTGGSIAHLATGNGWQTTFVLVNTGTSAAQAHLRFFADDGTALSLPLSFPQLSGSTSTVASSVDQTLAAGATLLVQSVAPLSNPAPTIGSAQLTTDGNVSGFVIFRYNPNGQEAVVPLESRTAPAYVLAFDNTASTATGVAINTVSSQAVSIPVVVRDDAGNQLATDSLNLAANGHLAFTLVSDKYPATANGRGTIEFDAPAGAQIGVLGIRIPIAHTFTTLPALAK